MTSSFEKQPQSEENEPTVEDVQSMLAQEVEIRKDQIGKGGIADEMQQALNELNEGKSAKAKEMIQQRIQGIDWQLDDPEEFDSGGTSQRPTAPGEIAKLKDKRNKLQNYLEVLNKSE